MALLHLLPNIIKPAQNPVAVSRESIAPNAPNMVKYQQKRLEMSHLLEQVQEDSLKELVVIDSMQRFGIDHYFEDQITQSLTQQYKDSQTLLYNDNLYAASLRFRLLRQQGFHVPADVFNSFKGGNMKFKNALSEDIRGLMALHEASHLCIEDEDILDEASIFTTNLLSARLSNLDDSDALIVQNTLHYPYHKSLARFTINNYLKTRNLENDWEKLLADLARMDFNAMQCIYREEILQVFKWWKELGLSEELKLARNQPLKWYIWSVAMATNPTLSRQRIEITKPISLVYIVDDIFDVYGTLDELILFTETINRWEVADDKLPSYMKMCFKVIHDTTHEISNVVYQEFGWDPIDHLKKAWASLCNAFLTEAKWFASGHSPKAEEYLKNGIISSGIPMVLTNLFFLLGYGESTWNTDIEGIISSVAAILRLLDDLGTAEDEEQEGNDGSYMEYYIKEQEGWSLSDGRQHVLDKVSQEWKLLNKHCLSPTTIPTSFKTACLNVARLVPMMYAYNDNHRLPLLEEHVKFMFSNTKEDLMW
ncbi:PREDICTED: (3S,6E)-nerolidol synthase 1-like [Ipomoea nil]|uniref:(3S,6E)-nerolidol synthase 1-like n=1 Tax=Ipomoea nil TaxID=35883 RepID=UPI0009011997|nr:PREDICTED: (3S,6E)-nerolidol synthase 1-like [Ipomoea nil]